MNPVDRLFGVSSASLVDPADREYLDVLCRVGPRQAEFARILAARNGFYAFESAFHLFPTPSALNVMDVAAWNAPGLWRQEYGDAIPADVLCFAEDLFGGQFCICGDRLQSFDPETGRFKQIANTFEEFFRVLLDDYRVMTGWPLAHAWQESHGKIPSGSRLVPKIPFVAGGEFVVTNLYVVDATAGMKQRAGLARQIRKLPDGAKIKITVKR